MLTSLQHNIQAKLHRKCYLFLAKTKTYEIFEAVFKPLECAIFLRVRFFVCVAICCMLTRLFVFIDNQRAMYYGLSVLIFHYFFFLFFGGGIAAMLYGAMLIKCSVTMHFNVCTLSFIWHYTF